MKKQITFKAMAFALVALTIAACSSSNDVVSGRMITKRKHNKGFHLNLPEKWRNTEGEDVAKNAPVIEEERTKVVSAAPVENRVEATVETETINQATDQITDATVEQTSPVAEKISVSDDSQVSSAAPEVKNLTRAERKAVKQEIKALKKSAKKDDVPVALLYVLCFFIPFVAVGLVTDWELKPVLINILLTFLCGIPGIIHAIVVVSKNT